MCYSKLALVTGYKCGRYAEEFKGKRGYIIFSTDDTGRRVKVRVAYVANVRLHPFAYEVDPTSFEQINSVCTEWWQSCRIPMNVILE